MPAKNTQAEFPRHDAVEIWQAGVAAVDPRRIVANSIRCEVDAVNIGGCEVSVHSSTKVVVVGAGKAVDGMALGALDAFRGAPIHLSGWVNAIDDSRLEADLKPLHRHPARPLGVNEPTSAAVAGTLRILKIVSQIATDDICVCLLSGGGSALLTAPPVGVSLEEKLKVIRHLSAAGASIEQLNAVRRCLSLVKGGGLAGHCAAKRLVTLIISDVLGDPLEAIASGPTVVGSRNAGEALRVLQEFTTPSWNPPASVQRHLLTLVSQVEPPVSTVVEHRVLANNQTAVAAAAQHAAQLGYQVVQLPLATRQPDANAVGIELAERIPTTDSERAPICVISGGEPTVTLAPESERGHGGRNQQLVLAALAQLVSRDLGQRESPEACSMPFALLSGGTDGEDGPTDAAGAIVDHKTVNSVGLRLEEIRDHLRRNDAYTFLDRIGGLLRSGPTGTNVCDLRVVLWGDRQP